MITNFKLYEMNEDKPEVCDYVICSHFHDKLPTYYEKEQNFIENKVGKIIKVNWSNRYPYAVTYDNIPDGLWNAKINDDKVLLFRDYDIEHLSKNKEELEQIINIKKFNL